METTEQGEGQGVISEAEHLLIFLRDRDFDCPLCGYNLRSQVGGRCPECGRELRLSVGLTEPYLRAWIALAFVQFAIAGIGILFIYACIERSWPRVDGIGSIALGYVLISPIGALAICLGRRQLLRLSAVAQWTLAASALIAALLAIILFYNASYHFMG